LYYTVTIPSDGNGQEPPQFLGHAIASLGSGSGGFEQSSHRQEKLYVAERAGCLWARGRVVSTYDVKIYFVINDREGKKQQIYMLTSSSGDISRIAMT
jgi:hypothetical protein